MARYWQTLITATVLTEGDAPPTFDTLAHVHEAISDGDASGEWKQQDGIFNLESANNDRKRVLRCAALEGTSNHSTLAASVKAETRAGMTSGSAPA